MKLLSQFDFSDLLQELDVLRDCRLCPRHCGANRLQGQLGYCRLDAGFSIASITLHLGEEPALVGRYGICNLFFPHCNLQCIYCQNCEISSNISTSGLTYQTYSLTEILEKICAFLDQEIPILGFVSPSHCIPQMKIIIKALHKLGKKPTIVYNTNGYDDVQTLRDLEGLIDVYLPDFKYIDPEIAQQYSGAKDYPQIVKLALQEMIRQKGTYVAINDDGYVESGLIIRHLVLPNLVENSLKILEYLAEQVSTDLYISLMSQYYPAHKAYSDDRLNRQITADEYETVVSKMHELGFYRGWIQEPSSHRLYRPDFKAQKPFGV